MKMMNFGFDNIDEKRKIEDKALQKYPFTLNNKTYFSSQCFFDDTIINGVELEIYEGKGLSNNEQFLQYLNYSQKLIYHAGCNILAYNTYRRNVEIICETGELCMLKALSLSSPEKQYVVWGQNIRYQYEKQKVHTKLCVYSVHRKAKICDEKFLTLPEFQEIFVFMHPIKIIGALHYDQDSQKSILTFKKKIEQKQNEFDEEFELIFPYDMRKMKYEIDSNSYIFSSGKQLFALKVDADNTQLDDVQSQTKHHSHYNTENFTLCVKHLFKVQTQIIHFCVNEGYIVVLIGDQVSRKLIFYSAFNHEILLEHQIQSLKGGKILNSTNLIENDMPLINFFEFRKSVIIGIYGNTSCICIFSIYQQNIKHVRDTQLGLENCSKIAKLFINPFSSEVLLVSEHYEVEGTLVNSIKSRKTIPSSEVRYKNFHLEASSFFITMEASMINIKKLGLSKRKYVNILTLTWTSQTYIQTQNSILNSRWEEKFDASIRASAIHPTGQFIALGFSDCFKIYYLTYEGLEHSYITYAVKQCNSISFSQYGNQFAVATSCSILIYQCYGFTKKHQVSIVASHKIENLSYTKNFLYCMTKSNRLWVFNANLNYKQQFTFNPRNHIQNPTIAEGLIYRMLNKNEKQSTNMQNNQVNSIFHDQETGMVIFSAACKIYFVSSLNYQCIACYDFENISCMQYCRPIATLFLGTVSGKLIAYPWPNKPINIGSKLPVFACHNEKIQKIKITTDLFYVVSITENCLYKHELTLILQMRKINKLQLQRQYSPSVILSLDFLQRKGLCLFSVDQSNRKYEQIKQNQEEALNLDFMLPEERQKQKNTMLQKLTTGQQQCKLELAENYQPLKILAINMKNKNNNVEEDSMKLRISASQAKQAENQQYRLKMSELCAQKYALSNQLNELRTSCLNAIKKEQSIMKNQSKIAELQHYVKINQLKNNTNLAEIQKKKTDIEFLQLDEIDKQKNIHYSKVIKVMNEEIVTTTQRSGYLMCRNTNLQKQISSKTRKIQEIVDLIVSIKRSINMLPKKQLTTRQLSEQKNTNNIIDATERRYLRQTKNLIQKNKAINVSIQMYSKQKDMLITLQKQIQTSEKEINVIIKYLEHEKRFKEDNDETIQTVIQKVREVMELYKVKNLAKTKLKNQYQTFKYSVALYLDGVIGLDKLKQISEIAPEDMIKAPIRIQKQISWRKKKLDKVIDSENKVINLMNNDRKLFSNDKKKIYFQNQDLLTTYNFLSHRNKYLKNVINSQQSPQVMSLKIRNKTKRKETQISTKPTPFQKYLKFKTSTRRMKTSPCVEYQL